ncbi:peptidase domain-containing ABC transporter [[Clostridium] polysaccharolyticum]|uniref:ATP-binding cassette, subfamily B n=1 Tax=[Clostridium] polysaccharolyticum TaxID=29364 RepID=A0A1I0DIL6_9FIRM|nr:peptidase domain-containing ABC transporter [[Clostridium] polysaccharolyticum]SET32273.1 ATP-binding cassette, subfamily B [[Clostridium] polysaccharolyticum]
MGYYCEKQHDVSDCAAACLVSIAHYYGYHFRVAKARDLSGTDLNGTNIDGILRAAKAIGLDGDAIRCNKYALLSSQITYPCIAHVIVNNHLYHYVVVYKATEKYIWIGDPARGVLKIKLEDFLGESENEVNGVRYKWTGVLVRFQKGEGFVTNKSTTKAFFWNLIMREKRLLTGALILSAVYSVLGLSGSLYYKLLLDSVLPHQKKTLLTMFSVGILLTYLLQFGLNMLRSFLILHLSRKIELHLQTSYMNKVLKLGMHFFERRKAGDLVSRFRDADNVKEAISTVVITLVVDGILVLVGMAVLWRVHLAMFIWAIVTIAFYLLLVSLFNDKFERYNTMWMEYGSELSSNLIETFKGIETVKAYNLEAQMKKNNEKSLKKLLDCVLHYGQDITLQATMQQVFDLIGGVVILWIGGINVMDGKMTVGQLMLYYSLFQYFSGPIISIVNMQPKIQTAIVAGNRINEVLEMSDEEEQEEKDAVVSGDICFQDVTFGYRLDVTHVDHVNLKIRQGEKIAVIGENGSGKSTLFKLLLGFYPVDQGRITIGGTDIVILGYKSVRANIGYVNQETFFFSEKIRDNLLYGTKDVSEERMIQICKLIKAHDFIESQPFGYDTVLQESGSNLSSGQRQRLALARALLKNPEILVLDEFTSNIDSETEKDIKHILYHEFREKTVIFITHKIQTFSDCDAIYRMEKGKLEKVEMHKTE